MIRARQVVLRPGEARSIEFDLRTGATLVGTLLDEEGAPVVGQAMWLLRQGVHDGDPHLLSRGDDVVGSTRTDSSGRFGFQALDTGTWLVGPAPVGLLDEERSVREGLAVPLARAIEIERSDQVVEVELTAFRSRSIEGRAVDADGRPVVVPPGVGGIPALTATRVSDSLRLHGWLSAGGFFLGPLPPGTYRIEAETLGRDLAPEPVLAEAGTTDVLLRFRRGGSIEGAVVDGGTGSPCQAEVVLALVTDAESSDLGRSLRTANSGEYEFFGLEERTYTVAARTRDGRVGVVIAGEIVSNGKWRAFRVPAGEVRIELWSGSARLEPPDRVETVTIPAGQERELVIRD